MARIDAFLRMGREQGCSDVHFTVGLPPLLRLDGELVPMKYRELTTEETLALIDEIIDSHQKEQFEKAGRDELAKKERSEIEVIARYLPQQLDEAATRTLLEGLVAELRRGGGAGHSRWGGRGE